MGTQPVVEPYERILLAMAIGDSLGFPAEGLSPGRLEKLGWSPWRQRFIGGFGMVSDDSDHAHFTAEAIFESACEVDRFRTALARKLRFWLLTVPPTIGFATARSIGKLLVGVSPEKSGVFSAGNGPAMRSAVIGAVLAEDPELRHAYVEASTLLTHKDPRALTGARAVADCVAWMQEDPWLTSAEIRRRLETFGDQEWLSILEGIRHALNEGASVREFALSMGLENGVTGYIYHTVPLAIFSWLRHREQFRVGMEAVLDCGGDTDTVGAIYGALAAAELNANNQIPASWHERVIHWPRMEPYMLSLKDQYGAFLDAQPARRFSAPWPALAIRNLQTLVVVLWHGVFLRFLPAAVVRRLVP